MTKEELEKEATEYAKPLDIKYGGSFVRTTEEVKQAYLAGAEPREKKIKELEEEILYLTMGKESLQNLGWPEAIQLFANKEKHIANLEKENAKLKGEADSVLDNWCRGDDPCPHLKKREEQLAEAKEIIRMVIDSYNHKERFSFEKDLIKAEQFLNSEVKK